MTTKRHRETVSVFDKYADQYLRKYENYVPYIESYEILNELLQPDDASVLDVACGPGVICSYLLQRKPELKVHGIDLSEKMLEIAARQNPSASFERRDCRDLGAFTTRFDAIVCGFIVPYLGREELARFVEDCRRILCSEGILYLSAITGEYGDSGYQSNDSADRLYTYYYGFDELITLLRATSFTMERAVCAPSPLQSEPQQSELFLFARAC